MFGNWKFGTVHLGKIGNSMFGNFGTECLGKLAQHIRDVHLGKLLTACLRIWDRMVRTFSKVSLSIQDSVFGETGKIWGSVFGPDIWEFGVWLWFLLPTSETPFQSNFFVAHFFTSFIITTVTGYFLCGSGLSSKRTSAD